MALRHRARGGAILGENPWNSAAWKELIVIDTYAGPCDGQEVRLELLQVRLGLSLMDRVEEVPLRSDHVKISTILHGPGRLLGREAGKRHCRGRSWHRKQRGHRGRGRLRQ